MRRLGVVALLALILTTAPAKAERACIQGPLQPEVISGARGRIAGSGGVIVVSGTTLPDWRFRDLNRIVRPHVVTLAPGLAIYHPPPLAGTEVVLETAEHGVVARTERALTIDAGLGAPSVISIRAGEVTTGWRTVSAALADAVPEHALIVIVSRIEGTRIVPLTWANVRASSPREYLLLWHPPAGCMQTVEGSREPKAGDRVVLSWVDDAGRLSEPSQPIVIAARSKGK